MKQKLFFLLLCSGMLMHLAAQRIEVSTPRLVSEAGTEAYHPKFTPDGSTILLTSENFGGLKAFNLETQTVRELSSAVGAGWNALVSSDSRTVFFQAIDFSNNPWGTKTFHAASMETGQARDLSALDNAVVQPSAVEGLLRARTTAEQLVVAYANEDLQIVVERNGQKTVLTPNGDNQRYIWVSLSPDKSKIVYTVSSLSQTFIADLDGNVLANLGRLSAPAWLGNDFVIGMNDVDDGRVVTQSNIVGVSADGQFRQNLTQAGELIAMFPSASPDGSMIAFNTLDGKLYLMEVIK